jgi:hypothetical protein
MLTLLALAMALAIQSAAQSPPPQILQIYREGLKPGSEAAYHEIEADTARLQAELACPHPYLAIESLTGPKEVWFFNGYESPAEQKQVVEAYARNTRLLAAITPNSKRKARLTRERVEVFATYRPDLGVGVPWIIGRGRFLVITVTKSKRQISGTVFESADGTRFIVTATQARKEADIAAATAGPDSRVFAVRPAWSFPAKEWIAADSVFWRSGSAKRN